MATQNIFDMADTWNAGSTTFTAIKMNVTDTASAAASLLMDLLVGGTSKFSVRKDGRVDIGAAVNAYDLVVGNVSNSYGIAVKNFGVEKVIIGGYHLTGNSSYAIRWGNSTTAGAAADLILERDAAGTLAQRNGANAQTKRVYGTYTDASNYRRIAMGMTTAGVATLAPEGAGTGASGNVLHISGLPTSNPGAGILWNNAGTPAIGT